MAKKKEYHLNQIGLESLIQEFCTLNDTSCLNPHNKQTRYFLEKDERKFCIDVYFKMNNRISIQPTQMGDLPELSRELIGYIDDNLEYKDVVNGTFTTTITYETFKELQSYLDSLEGVECIKNEDKNQNGLIIKYRNDYGDSVTLTYYESKEKLYFQGLIMDLYVLIKTYLSPFVGNTIPVKILNKKEESLDGEVNCYIKRYLSNGYPLLAPEMQNFVLDSFTLVVAGTKLRDYAAWAMPAIRALEHSIKRICLEKNIIIDDPKGFMYQTGTGHVAKIFFVREDNITINRNLESTFDNDTIDILVRSYDYLIKNRHEMFHTTQIVQGTKLVETPQEAKTIIIGACQLIEESLVLESGN